MSRRWRAIFTEVPEFDPEFPTDPQDWKIELELTDETGFVHELIHITFTGTLSGVGDDGDYDAVVMVPGDVIEARIDAMLRGLNSKRSLKLVMAEA